MSCSLIPELEALTVNCDTKPVEIVEIVVSQHLPEECALDTIPEQRCCMLKHAFESSSLCCAKGAAKEPKENNTLTLTRTPHWKKPRTTTTFEGRLLKPNKAARSSQMQCRGFNRELHRKTYCTAFAQVGFGLQDSKRALCFLEA